MKPTKGDLEITKNTLSKLLKKLKTGDVYDAVIITLIYLDVEM